MLQFLSAFILWAVLLDIGNGQKIDNVENIKYRILGGMNAVRGEFPWQVAIWVKDEKIQEYILWCGGAIIKRQWVITVAHCLYGIESKSIMIQIGKTNLNEKEPYERLIEISNYINHKQYDDLLALNDIGLIKLSEPLEYNRDVRPIRISNSGVSYENMTCITSGWGHTSLYDMDQTVTIRNPNLQRVSLLNWPKEKCDEHPNYICSGGFPEGGKGACQGDSGGPIQCFLNDHYVLIGLVSHGDSCGLPEEPDYSTSIGYYNNWIIETLSQDV